MINAILAFVFGTIIGSFLNVCIHRIPRNESIITPGSRCACGKVIRWYDNIPILSWLLLGAKARCCKRKITARYPVVELLTGLLFLFCWIQFSPTKAIPSMFFCALLIGAAFIDGEHLIIPESFSLGGVLVGILFSFIFPALHVYPEDIFLLESLRSGGTAIAGAVIGSGLIFWIREGATIALKKEAMGYGDIAFTGMIGAFCGWQGAVFSVFGGALVGLILVSVYKVWNVLFKKNKPVFFSENDATSENALPFGPMLAIAALIYLLLMQQTIDRYLEPFFAR